MPLYHLKTIPDQPQNLPETVRTIQFRTTVRTVLIVYLYALCGSVRLSRLYGFSIQLNSETEILLPRFLCTLICCTTLKICCMVFKNSTVLAPLMLILFLEFVSFSSAKNTLLVLSLSQLKTLLGMCAMKCPPSCFYNFSLGLPRSPMFEI